MRKLHTLALVMGLMAIAATYLNAQITRIQPAAFLTENDVFGTSVALNADATYLVVGAPDSLSINNRGAGLVYLRSGTSWAFQDTLYDLTLDLGASLGVSAAINGAGTRVALGAPFQEMNNRGAVVLFERNGATWAKAASQVDLGTFVNTNDHAGSSVALDETGNYIAIGVPGDNNGDGKVVVCNLNGGVWSCVNIPNPSAGSGGQDQNDFFGASVSLNETGEVLVIGAPGEDNANDGSGVNFYGATYVYRRTGTNDWVTIPHVKLAEPAGLSSTTYLGKSVDTNNAGDSIIVGAPGYFGDGAAFVYKYTGGNWSNPPSLIFPSMEISTGDGFGFSVSMDGTGGFVFIGAPGNDPVTTMMPPQTLVNAGAVFTFKYSPIDGAWIRDKKMCLLDNNNVAGDLLGASVALASDLLYGAAGAPLQEAPGKQNAGAAYVFQETALPVTWLSFRAVLEGNDVKLSWSTASESNNDGFAVQRSGNGRDWQTIGFVKGVEGGTTSEVQKYEYTDPSPFTLHPSLYYRLEQRDNDGTTDYSPVRVVQLNNQGGIRVYPNPADEVTTIAFGEPTEARGWIRLLNGNGRLLAEHAIPIGTTAYELRVAQLPAGTYLLEIKVGVKEWMRRLVVE